MEDLKENIQKKNMKKLVLSAALGMFCYCSNNVTMGMKDTNFETGQQASIELQQNIPQDRKTKSSQKEEECCPCCCCHNNGSEEKDVNLKKNEQISSNVVREVEELEPIKEL